MSRGIKCDSCGRTRFPDPTDYSNGEWPFQEICTNPITNASILYPESDRVNKVKDFLGFLCPECYFSKIETIFEAKVEED